VRFTLFFNIAIGTLMGLAPRLFTGLSEKNTTA
jgi:hypothetical protein